MNLREREVIKDMFVLQTTFIPNFFCHANHISRVIEQIGIVEDILIRRGKGNRNCKHEEEKKAS